MQTFLRQRRYADLGFVLLLVLALALTGLALFRYGEDLAANVTSSQMQFGRIDARHLEEDLSQTLQLADLGLGSLLESGYDRYTPVQWNDALAATVRHAPYFRSLSLLNGEGRIVASSNPRNVGLIPALRGFLPDTSDWSGVLRLGGAWSGRDFESGEAVADGQNGRPRGGFIPVLRGKADSAIGTQVLLAALDVDYFLKRFDQDTGTDIAWADVLRLDGKLLISTRDPAAPFRDSASNQALVPEWRGGNEFGEAVETLADGSEVLTAWRQSHQYPIAVVVRRDLGVALAAARGEQEQFALTLLPLVLGLLLVTTLSYIALRHFSGRRMRAQLEARDHLTTLLDSLPAIAIVVDGRGRISQSNRVWQEFAGFHALPRGLLGSKASYTELAELFQSTEEGSDIDLGAGIATILHRQMAFFEGEFRLDTARGPRWFHVLVRNFGEGEERGAVLLALDITRHHEADQRLRLDGRVFSASAEAIVITDASNRIISVNPAFTRITGYTLEEVRGQNPRMLGSGEQSRSFYADLWKALESTGSWQGEIINRNKHGELYPEWLSISLDRDSDGTIRHFIGIFSDISAIKQTENALRLSEERYRRTLAAVQDGMWSWQIDAAKLSWDARCYEMLGFAADEFPVTRERWLEMMHPEDRAVTWAHLEAGLHSDHLLRAELRLRSAQGLWFWVEFRGKVVDWAREAPALAVGTLTDINERKATEQRLRLLDAAVRASPVAIVVTDTQAVIQSVNPAFTRLTGFAAAEAIGHRPNELVRSGMQTRAFYEALWGTILSGNTWHGELINRHRDGSFYHEELTIAPVRDELGSLRNFVAIKQDITARKNAEAALIATRGRLAAVIANFQGAVMVEDEWRNVVLVNQTFCDTFGFDESPEQLIGRPWEELMNQHDLGVSHSDQFFERLGELLALRQPVLGEEISMRDGRELERDYIPIQSDHTFLGHLRVYRDITERKERERTLRRLATTDPLTGVYNRRHFMEQVEQELARHQRYRKPASLVMLDLDHFKRINDTYGHAAGDAVLCHCTALTHQVLRRVDALGRLGGEEFAILLPHTPLEGAREFAERLRERIVAMPAQHEGVAIPYSTSLGVTDFSPGDSPDSILARADAALYLAKEGGRNRVIATPAPEAEHAAEDASPS